MPTANFRVFSKQRAIFILAFRCFLTNLCKMVYSFYQLLIFFYVSLFLNVASQPHFLISLEVLLCNFVQCDDFQKCMSHYSRIEYNNRISRLRESQKKLFPSLMPQTWFKIPLQITSLTFCGPPFLMSVFPSQLAVPRGQGQCSILFCSSSIFF